MSFVIVLEWQFKNMSIQYVEAMSIETMTIACSVPHQNNGYRDLFMILNHKFFLIKQYVGVTIRHSSYSSNPPPSYMKMTFRDLNIVGRALDEHIGCQDDNRRP